MKQTLLSTILVCGAMTAVNAQRDAHKDALEGIYIEKYYISDVNDATDTDGGSLKDGSVTYRIYVDMLPGYGLQAVYGETKGEDVHDFNISTTTEFFNNEDRGAALATEIGQNRLGDNTVAVDSWLTIGAASDKHMGIPKSLDSDGSIVGGENNDGGSEGIEGGLLVNNHSTMHQTLTTADGLYEGDTPLEVTTVGITADMFVDENSSDAFSATGGSVAVLGEVFGVTEENHVLIAQITTDGELSMDLNIQMKMSDTTRANNCPSGNVLNCPAVLRYVHTFLPSDELHMANDDVSIAQSNSAYFVYESKALTFKVDSDYGVSTTPVKNYTFELFPNPAQNELNLQISGVMPEASYKVYDAMGKVVLERNINGPVNLIKTDISSLKNGMYYFHLVSKDHQVVRPFFKN